MYAPRTDFDPSVRELLDTLEPEIASAMGAALVGLYVFGSVATGDFDAGISDVDLVAVLTDPPDAESGDRLRAMHEDIARSLPDWDDRIEVVYVSRDGLARCRTATTTIAVISPGERFRLARAGRDWILNWYPTRENAVALKGPPIGKLIPAIPESEYIEELREYLRNFEHRNDDDATLGQQAYAILSICRGVHTLECGERPSKRQAAVWAEERFPRWAGLIRRAVEWRERQHEDDSGDGRRSIGETRAFIGEMTRVLADR